MTHIRGIVEAIREATNVAENGIYSQHTVTTTPVRVLEARTPRKALIIQNLGPGFVYVGFDNSVSSSNGVRLINREVYSNSSYSGEIWVVSDSSADIRVEEVY